MSWSFYGVGRAAAVAAKARNDLENIQCAEPEQTIKGQAVEIIEASLKAYPPDTAVRIEASGSQTTHSATPGAAVNNLRLSIEPLYGFVE